MEYLLFYLVILLANIMHGITGFAGTVLAMPFGLMLVGYPVAKPVLNVLAIIAGLYVFAGYRAYVNWKELRKIVIVMAAGIVGGILIRGFFADKEQVLYLLLGIFVILLSLQGLWKQLRTGKENPETEEDGREESGSPGLYLLLGAAGIIHGIFVSGGPLLIGYLAKRIRDKVSFRATISTIWIFLNSIILIDDIRAGLWNVQLLKVQLVSIPFLFAGMFIGSRLYAVMSQKVFMILTYILLFVSGVSLLLK
ncbi:MAG: sulfite exporter TauE/SafE family protein [Eubacteriales bacterium]|nr:sulfite exporter TauE/SafE family protein [Eubacteriales bacterium]